MPTPSVDPALANYSPLLVEAESSYPAGADFVGDGLSPDEKNILDLADSRLFANPNFLAGKHSPDNWPSEVKLASVQAVPVLMLLRSRTSSREPQNGQTIPIGQRVSKNQRAPFSSSENRFTALERLFPSLLYSLVEKEALPCWIAFGDSQITIALPVLR